ncbi:MAG: phosphoenolpyruvate synthase [Chitinispirillaceae bacterium]
MAVETQTKYVRWLEDLTNEDVAEVGGKNASLGEMIRNLKHEGVRVPDGFATTANAYRDFLTANHIDKKIGDLIDDLKAGRKSLEKVGRKIRGIFNDSQFPQEVAENITGSYRRLSEKYGSNEIDVAVRSSATAEDLPGASFAGQQETFLNITGEEELLDACRRCYASLFTNRAISYRTEKGFDHMKVALSVGVQKMVRSDLAGSGVMFSLDTDTGFPDLVVINAAWGLGENVVQGVVNPDEYQVFKPLIDKDGYRPIIEKANGDKEKKMVYSSGGSATTRNVHTSKQERSSFVLQDEEIIGLARWASVIEKHYDKPMDMEWAKDGKTGDLFVVQARPETVHSQKKSKMLNTYTLKQKGEVVSEGLAIGESIASGKAQIIKSAEHSDQFEDGAILVTGMTDPDWVPIMKKSSGIITDHGGRTSHAAIVSRELGIPAVVGTGDATRVVEEGSEVTISCAEGNQGYVYRGRLDYDERQIDVNQLPDTKTRIMINIASPDGAFRWWQLPAKGIGLARMEFIINNVIKIHPMALVNYHSLQDQEARRFIERATTGYEDKTDYFVENLARGIARIAASQYPDPVIVRMSDFKTNEYANLVGGAEFEPEEQNPMLGFRGASRYYSEKYQQGFALECRAIRKVREQIGLQNVLVMIPFCRTPEEGDRVLEVLRRNGLQRGKDGLEVYVMCEIPSNIVLAEQFADRFDGFSIGSNDLTQLMLGVDRDSGELKQLFDERNEAVKTVIADLIKRAHRKNKKVGICGQAPSDYPEFAQFLVEQGIDSISLNPDSVIDIVKRVSEIEKKK